MLGTKANSSRYEQLHLLVFGAGAIGAYIGGSLALQGHRVVFLEKPEVIEIVSRQGLKIHIGDDMFHVPEPILAAKLDQALEYGPFDAAVMALKSYDTPGFLEILHPFAAQIPPVLCLQNGVENEMLLADKLGSEKVIAGTVTSAVGRLGPGKVILERLRGVGIAAGNPLSSRLDYAFQQAGLQARLYASASAMKWSKLLTNLLANATSAILDMTPAEIFAHRDLYLLEVAQLCEALKVMQAHQIEVVDLPATQVRLLAFIIQRLSPRLSQLLIRRAVGGGRGNKMPSFHIDLHSRRGMSEVDSLNGAVVRFGQKAGLETPVNRLLTDTLLGLTRGEIPLEQFSRQPEKLLSLWRSPVVSLA